MSDTDDLMRPTVRIATAYLSKNAIPTDQLPSVIRDIHGALLNAGRPLSEPTEPMPAVAIRRSVRNDAVTCLECGRPMKMLKRHLRVDHGLSVPDYKAKWRLPADYPMVAPDYALIRSEAAKRIGLGRGPAKKPRRRKAPAQDAPAA